MNVLVPKDWLVTPLGDKRGYIQPHTLSELWFHVGTACNLACAYSKMVVKLGGRMRVYACTLVDDDPAYDQGGSLREAFTTRVMMRHHRC